MSEYYLKEELYQLIEKDSKIFNFIESGSLDGLWYWDLEDIEKEWMSPQFWITLGYNPKEKKHLASEWKELVHPEDLKLATESFNKHLENPNHPYDNVVRYKHKNGSTAWVRCRGVVIRNKEGKPIRMLGAHNDITELKENEIKLKNSLKEKDLLMKEMNHRIKNNINLIISLLNIKSQNDGIDLSNISKRLYTISAFHDNMSLSEDFQNLNIKSHLNSVLDFTFDSDKSKYELHVDDEIKIDSKRIVKVGLLANELATNARKYGMQNDNDKFVISLKVEDGFYEFNFSNDGQPPKQIPSSENGSLGMIIVDSIVSELEGVIEKSIHPKMNFTIRIPR